MAANQIPTTKSTVGTKALIYPCPGSGYSKHSNSHPNAKLHAVTTFPQSNTNASAGNAEVNCTTNTFHWCNNDRSINNPIETPAKSNGSEVAADAKMSHFTHLNYGGRGTSKSTWEAEGRGDILLWRWIRQQEWGNETGWSVIDYCNNNNSAQAKKQRKLTYFIHSRPYAEWECSEDTVHAQRS